MKRKLIIFTRYPVPGKTKTRLIPETGEEQAAKIQRRMTERTVLAADLLRETVPDVHTEIWFCDGSMEEMRKWLGPSRTYIEQPDGDLGARMEKAFRSSFSAGFSHVLLIGIDCPGLTEHILASAFSELRRNDLVLGPTADGGYYLIGMPRQCPQLFEGVPWGTETVLAETRARAKANGITPATLAELRDVDTPADLPLLEQPSPDNDISVIIPAFNEEQCIARTIESAKAGAKEIIVVDGGSGDRTKEIAEGLGASVMSSEPGRAAQMNAGARAAKSGILLFLHADTILPGSYAAHAREALEAGAAFGAFNLKIDSPALSFRMLEVLVSFRSHVLEMPYGDQSIFVRKDAFHALDGFADMKIMEDYDFVKRARKRFTLSIANAAVTTSARRWERLGILRTTFINQRVIASYHLGAGPERLAEIYTQAKGANT